MLTKNIAESIRSNVLRYTHTYLDDNIVSKCPECRKEKDKDSWIVRETPIEFTTSKYCPDCFIKKRKEFDDFMKTLIERSN